MTSSTSAMYTSSADYVNLFMRISSRMLTAKDEASFMEETLADIGTVMQVGRSYVFEQRGQFWSNTYEWTSEGVASQKDDLQNISYEYWQDEGSILYSLRRGDPYVVEDIAEVNNEATRAILHQGGIVALVTVPLFDEEGIVGLFGLDQCVHKPGWSQETVNAAIILGNVISNAKAYFKTQRRFARKKAQTQALFDAFPYPIYVSSMDDYSILFYNKAIAELFDVSKVEQEKCYKILQNLDAPCPFCTNAFLEKGAPPYVWHHHNPITEKDYKIVDRCTSWERTDHARLSVALDITDSLRLQRERVFEREANAAKGDFLANMSHELRTPLNGIIGMTHLAHGANDNVKVQDFIDKIQLSSRNLLAIINDILDFSKLESNEITLEREPFSFSDLLFETQAILQTEAERKGLDLQCHVDENLFSSFYGDTLRLSQVLLNLGNNALKFTEQGFVRFEVQVLEDKENEQSLALCVQDSGIGISSENIEKLFTAFTQADASTTRNYGGTGLGLTITQHLVQLMGGSIRVESVLGEGASFICTIPFSKVFEEQKAKQKMAPKQNAKMDISGVRILLVEDNEINALIAREVLEQYGCCVDTAEDGFVALDKLKSATYDLVLMDIQMPRMDGLEATRRIREMRAYDTLPVVAMSAHALVQDYEKSRDAGMQAHVIKPFVPEELRAVIHQFVSKPFELQNNKG